ncbi:MAG TPA: bifunctional glutamate N-acetyltransferase/amino-acid acetyltransferase ArgJ [Candidatus Ornithoclostridium faecavium]|nr:bifunctional glutamate N-acetyltransferase/amino-acid acetyltransferase ArgJ [Candidatus Ornithoclostridium faecavium]
MRDIEGGICAPQGFKAEGVHCGIRKNKQKRDLALIVSDVRCTAAAVYTTNKVKGAPIAVTRSNIADGYAQAVICNSGNANTCNADGELKAQRMCELAAQYTGVDAKDVIVASTGVIGQVLPIEPIEKGMPSLSEGLSYYGSGNAAEAIMTTDTVKKEFAVGFMTGGKHCRIGAIAKGSGMIHPNMATLLCFLTTDVAISADALHSALYDVIQDTLNMVSIDGDTSTNDMVSILANGEARNTVIDNTESDDYRAFKNALTYVMTKVSRAIAKDGEGATRLMECKVSGAKDKATAKTIAKSVVCSSLLKAAIFAADANWGRILCAIGYADAEFDITKIDVDLASSKGVIAVCRGGNGVEFSEEKAKEILLEDEVQILVRCNDGAAEAVAWGCDLTYDYVKINADYRT